MSVKEKLERLDEIVLHQFDKITQKAHETFGWSKYDLARKADSVKAGSLFGCGIYGTIQGYLINSPVMIIAAGFVTLTTPFMHAMYKKKNAYREKDELRLVERTGATKAPEITAIRPVAAGVLTSIAVVGALRMYFGQEPPAYAPELLTNDSYGTISGLSTIAIGLYGLADVAASYFRDTTMRPPKKKVGLFKRIYQKIFRRKKASEMIPAPTSEQRLLEDHLE